MKEISSFMIAGTHSGCGKTTVSLGIMASLVKRGLKVQPFKIGPDFIDPGHHKTITKRPSHNLDGWMMSKEYNQRLFFRYAYDSDVAVVEGVMGLFDGASGKNEDGSSAQMAKWLDIPVVLVVDASSMARSVAALCLGYKMFDPDLKLIGVILNKVSSPAHEVFLKEALEEAGIDVIGTLYKNEKIKIPSRHLGLFTAEEIEVDLNELCWWIEKGIDLDYLLNKSRYKIKSVQEEDQAPSTVRIAVAKDKAFCFYYEENFRLLRKEGAEIIFFSPLEDKKLPHPVDGVVFGGGYPELYLDILSSNRSLIDDIKKTAMKGVPIYAECGGFMYLMECIIKDGTKHKMVGIFPFICDVKNKLTSLGYREIIIKRDLLLGPPNIKLKGHEFHYSDISKFKEKVITGYEVFNRDKRFLKREGYVVNNVIGSYIHIHFGSNPSASKFFVEFCKKHKSFAQIPTCY